MQLNADIIFDNLPASLHAHIAGPRDDTLSLGRPEFFEGGEQTLLSKHLYFTTIERLPRYAHAERGASIICIGAGERLERYLRRCRIITLPSSINFYQAFNAIQRIYDRFDAWEQDLTRTIDSDANVSRLLDCSESIFGNAIYAIDGSFRVLGASQRTSSLPQAAQFSSADGTSLRLGAFDQFLELHDLSMEEREPMLLELLGQVTLNCNLFDEDDYQGCLTIHYQDRPYRESDRPLAAFLARMIERALKHLSREAPDGRGTVRQAVQDLVAGIPLDPMGRTAFERATRDRHFVCMRLKTSDRLANLPIGYVRNMVESTFPRSVTFEHHGNSVVSFIDLDELDKSVPYLEAIARGVAPFTGNMGLRAGISDPVLSILQARLYYLEANIALENGSLSNPEANVYAFEDYVLQDMIVNAMGELPLELLMPEGLRRLVEHDGQSATSYVNTLRCFLDNGMSISKTAAELYVHRSTLIERISRIKKALGLDLYDPEVQLRLRLLLKAMDIQESLRTGA